MVLAGVVLFGGYFILTSDRSAISQTRAEGTAAAHEPAVEAQPVLSASHASGTENPNRLSDADRKYIWDIEHIALILDVHVFPRMARAIRAQDSSAVAAVLADDFNGKLPDLASARTISFSYGESRVGTDHDPGWTEADRDRFVAYLMARRAEFKEPPKVELRLMRLSPVDRSVLEGPWHGTLKLRLAGEATDGRPSELEMQGHFTLESPGDDIEQREHWLKSCDFASARSNTATHFLMTEVAAARGIDRRRYHDNWVEPDQDPIVARGGVQICDFNRDGIFDILITDPREATLFQGQPGGQFRDVTESVGLAGRIQRAAGPAIFADFDGDGFEDLLIGSQMFRNDQGRAFTDVTNQTSIRLPADAGGFSVADYDLDGRVDLYVVRSSPGPAGRSRVSWVDDQSGPGNQLWRNIGGWQFRNVTTITNTSAGHRSCFSAVWLDANNDGRPDLAVADEFGATTLLVNQSDGRFTEYPVKSPFAGFCMGIVAGDFDNDGHTDIYLANMYSKAGDRIIANLPEDAYTPEVRAKIKDFVNGSELLRNRGDLTFESIGKAAGVNGVGWAYGPCFTDLNNDGWLDLYATAGFLSYTRGDPDG